MAQGGITVQQFQQMGGGFDTPPTPAQTQTGGISVEQFKQMGGTLPTDIIPPKPLGTYGQNVQEQQQSGLEQMKSGFQQIQKGAKAPEQATQPGQVIPQTFKGLYDILSGSGDFVAGGINTTFSPATAAVKTAGEAIPAGGGKNVGDRFNQVSQLVGDFFGSMPQLQRIVQLYPGDIVKDMANAITVGTTIAGGEKAPEIKTAVTDALDTTATKAAPIADMAKNTVNEMNPLKKDVSTPENAQATIETARQNVADAYKNSMPMTATQQLKEASLFKKTGDNVYTTLAKYNISPAAEDAIPQLQTISDRFSEATKAAQQNEHSWFNVEELRKNAYSSVDENLSSASERKAAKARIDTEISDLQNESPDSFGKNPEGQLVADSNAIERLRKTGNDWAQYNKLNPDTVKNATGNGLANAVRDQVEKEGTFPAYREVNREWSKVIHAQEVLQKIADSGKPFKRIGGLAGSISQKILSGVLGYAGGGIAGAIISELGTEFASKLLSNPDLRTFFDRQIIEKFGNADVTPQAVKDLKDQVLQYMENNKEHPVLQTAPEPQGNAEMGSYKLKTNPITKRVEPTGQYRKPNVPFYQAEKKVTADLKNEQTSRGANTKAIKTPSKNSAIKDSIPEGTKKSIDKKKAK